MDLARAAAPVSAATAIRIRRRRPRRRLSRPGRARGRATRTRVVPRPGTRHPGSLRPLSRRRRRRLERTPDDRRSWRRRPSGRAVPAAHASVHPGRGRHARPRHRRQHHHVLLGERRADYAAAGHARARRPGALRVVPPRRTRHRLFVPGLSRPALAFQRHGPGRTLGAGDDADVRRPAEPRLVRAGHGQLLRGGRHIARTRPDVCRRRRARARRRAGRRDQRRPVAHAFRRRAGSHRPPAAAQRAHRHHHRRDAPGLPGRPARPGDGLLDAHHAARPGDARQGSPDAGGLGMDGVARASQAERVCRSCRGGVRHGVQAPRHRARRQGLRRGYGVPVARRRGWQHRTSSASAPRPVGSVRTGAAHHLRQSRQSPAHARGVSTSRAGHPQLARRRTDGARTPAACRRPAPRRRRHDRRAGPCPVVRRSAHRVCAAQRSARRAARDAGLARAALCGWMHRAHDAALRDGTGTGGRLRRPRRRAQGRHADGDGTRTHAGRARRRAGHARDSAARAGGPAGEKPGEGPRLRPGLRSKRCAARVSGSLPARQHT